MNYWDADGRVLRVKGRLFLADVGPQLALGSEYLPYEPDIELIELLPDGTSRKAGVLNEWGVIEVSIFCTGNGRIHVEAVTIALWDNIEMLPDWTAPDDVAGLWGAEVAG